MLVAGIKSRPVYPGLTIQPRARRHIFALEGEGAKALLDQQLALDETVLSRSEILYVARGSQGTGLDEALRRLGADMFFTAPTIATLLFRLKGSLATAQMAPGYISRARKASSARRCSWHSTMAWITPRSSPSIAARWPGGCNVSIARASQTTLPPAPSPAVIADSRFWCAIIIPGGSPPSRASISTRKSPAAGPIRRSCFFERWH